MINTKHFNTIAYNLWIAHKAKPGSYGRFDYGYVDGEGPFAVVAICGGVPRITLHETEKTARLEIDLMSGEGKGLLSKFGCSYGCEGHHSMWDLRNIPKKAIDVGIYDYLKEQQSVTTA